MIERGIVQDQTYPKSDQIAHKLPISLQFVIFTNYFFSVNGWGVFFFFITYMIIYGLSLDLVYVVIMLIPSLVLSSTAVLISKKLLFRSNIIFSIFVILMNIVLLDMLNLGPISSWLGAGLRVNELYWFLTGLLLISLFLSSVSLFMLIFGKSLKLYYINKAEYIKPRFIRNFPVLSILVSLPLLFLYIAFFLE